MAKIKASRYHDICAGHRVNGHEGKCRHLHGHNYRVHFHCEAEPGHTKLDDIGRVIDFSVIKEKMCMWLEDNWDHHFLVWKEDLLSSYLLEIDPTVVVVPFNPTAENMAEYLTTVIGPEQFKGTGIVVVKTEIEETRKCSASYEV